MGYNPKHVYKAVKRLPKKVKVPAVLGIVGVLTFAFVGAASAAGPPGGVTQNSAGEAGYYVQEWNNWHIRDAHATFKITAAMEAMGGTAENGDISAVGTELCNPNDGHAAQLGLVYQDGTFEVLGQYGTLSIGTNDPCVQSGVILPVNDAIQLAGSTLIGKPGNISDPSADELALGIGETVTTDTYYNPTTHWVQFTVDVYSAAGSFLEERSFSQHIGFQNFYEGGIGVNNTAAPGLTAGATNPLVAFTDATFTNYNKSAVDKLVGGWDLVGAQTVNSGDQVTMTPTTPVGNSFSVLVGSESS